MTDLMLGALVVGLFALLATLTAMVVVAALVRRGSTPPATKGEPSPPSRNLAFWTVVGAVGSLVGAAATLVAVVL